MQLSCEIGHRMVALGRVIKHARNMTCILSCIVFSDLLPDLYFHDTDTWDSCDLHYLDYMVCLELSCYYLVISCSCDFMIMLHDSYSFRTSHVHCIHVTLCMHDFLVHDLSSYYPCYCYYFQFSILPNILFLCPTYCYYIFIFSPYCSFPSCTLAGPLLTNLYYFSVSRFRKPVWRADRRT